MTVVEAPPVDRLDELAVAARAAGVRFEDACYNSERPHRRVTVWHGRDRWEVWHVDQTITVTVAHGVGLPVYVAAQETLATLDVLTAQLAEGGA